LKDDLLRRMRETHHRQPATVCTRPALLARIDAAEAQQKALRCWRALPATRIAVARARTRSRIASCAASGTQTAVSSPARCNFANITASRRSVFTRSPAFRDAWLYPLVFQRISEPVRIVAAVGQKPTCSLCDGG